MEAEGNNWVDNPASKPEGQQPDETAPRTVFRPCPLCAAPIELLEISGCQNIICSACGLTCMMDVSPPPKPEPEPAPPEEPLAKPRVSTDDMSRWLAGEPIDVRVESGYQQLRQLGQQHQVAATFVGAAMIALVMGCLTMSLGYFGAVDELAQQRQIHASYRQAEDQSVKLLRRSFEEAAEQRRRAEHQREIADRKTHEITAKYLAMRSQSLSKRDLQQSAQLAIEAVNATLSHDELLVPIAHQSLRNLLADRHDGFRLEGHTGAITSLGISLDGRWLASGSFDNTVRLWDLSRTAPEVAPLTLARHQNQVSNLLFSNDNRWLVTGSFDSSVCLWDMSAEELSAVPAILKSQGGPISSLALSNDGRWLVTCGNDPAASGNSIARLWDLSDGAATASSLELKGHAGPSHLVAISPNSRWLVLGVNETARLWDLKSRSPAAVSLALHGHAGMISDAIFTRDNHWLITCDEKSGTSNSTARLWDLTAKDPSTSIVLQGHTGSIRTMAATSDSRWLITAGDDRRMKIWDLQSANPASRPIVRRPSSSGIFKVAISPDDRWLVAGATDGKLYLWSLTDQGPCDEPVVLSSSEGNLQAIVISPDSHWLAAAGEDQSIHLWSLKISDLLEHAIKIAKTNHQPRGNPPWISGLGNAFLNNMDIQQLPFWWSGAFNACCSYDEVGADDNEEILPTKKSAEEHLAGWGALFRQTFATLDSFSTTLPPIRSAQRPLTNQLRLRRR